MGEHICSSCSSFIVLMLWKMNIISKDFDSLDRLSNYFLNLNLKDNIHLEGASARPRKIGKCWKWECFVLHRAKHARIEHLFGGVLSKFGVLE